MPAATSSPRCSAPARWSARPSISTRPTASAAPDGRRFHPPAVGRPEVRRRLLPPGRHRDPGSNITPIIVGQTNRIFSTQGETQASPATLFRPSATSSNISAPDVDDGPALCRPELGQHAQIYRQFRRLGQRQHQLPGATNPFTITKTSTARTASPEPRPLTYTVTVTNPSVHAPHLAVSSTRCRRARASSPRRRQQRHRGQFEQRSRRRRDRHAHLPRQARPPATLFPPVAA